MTVRTPIRRQDVDGQAIELLARRPSFGPDWDAAIAAGVDVTQLEENLALTPEQRLQQLVDMGELWAALNPNG